MKWVDIKRYDDARKAFAPIGRCLLRDGSGTVEIETEVDWLRGMLEEGVKDLSMSKLVFPEDGEAFLKALSVAFRNPGLAVATRIQEGEPSPLQASA